MTSTDTTSSKQTVAFIQACWHRDIVDRCKESFQKEMSSRSDIKVECFEVAGAFEIPLVCQKAAAGGQYDAIIALGAVIRGGTPHFEYVAGECTKGLAQVSMQYSVPVSFGVLTVDSIEQAIERAGTKAGNKGEEAAMSAIEMVNLLKQM